ncbi:MAG: hypothetical protein E6I80_04765 [Chloroflexi bacterium]|nr:MAG: hypothetical protein E6I80_04765 [Chloroflexota bacterium]
MAEDQVEFAPRRCPRCGGLMVKRGGSPFYWHADYNHPRCDITNMVDPPVIVQNADEPSQQNEPPRKNHKHQKK